MPRRRRARPTEAETLTFSEHLACIALRAVVRRARAPQLLVQLAVRGVRALRRARDPLRGRPRARRPRRRPQPRRRGDRAVAGFRTEYFDRVLEAVGDEYGFDADTPWRKLRKRGPQRRCCTAPAHARPRPVPEPLRAAPPLRHALRGRGAVARAAPLRGRDRRSAGADRGVHARGAVPAVRRGAAAARRRSRSPSATLNIAELGELSIGEAAEFLVRARRSPSGTG